MNILIPHAWLLEHLDTTATPEQIQKYLSLCGPSVERINDVNGEPVYDIEVTTNRVDVMSVRGLAREAAAILPEFEIPATLKPLQLIEPKSTDSLDLNIVNDPALCKRILAIKLSHVAIKPSPQWLKQRLTQVGQRPLNNVIDITNYVMWELGHPIHAFDFDRLTQKTIIVRLAKRDETLTTLDDKTHTLRGGEVVFDDGTGNIIDLPGIMGTRNTVVTDTTKNVLLWIESVQPEKIRSASMAHAIRTQAAILNEKGVDPQLGVEAIYRAADLMHQLAQAQTSSQLIDIYPHPKRIQSIKLDQSLLDTYLGISIKPTRVTPILEHLGCKVAGQYTITPPSYRASDLTIPQDLIEEIARIYGYHNLPAIVMPTPIPDNPPPQDFRLEHQLKTWLADWGFTEVYTYSLVAKADGKQPLKLANPLTDDMVYLRQSLIPSHLEVVEKNKSRGEVSIFEMANIYLPQTDDLPTEELHLTLTTTRNYRFLKGILDALALKLHLTDYRVVPPNAIMANDQKIGTIGPHQTAFVADLLVEPLISSTSTHPRYIPVIAHPPIIEDLTFTLPPKTHVGPVIVAIKQVSPLIATVTLKDIFEHNYTFTVSYRSPKKSLTDKAITPIRQTIVTTLTKSFSASLVGNL